MPGAACCHAAGTSGAAAAQETLWCLQSSCKQATSVTQGWYLLLLQQRQAERPRLLLELLRLLNSQR
jgi:hypothetical protein